MSGTSPFTSPMWSDSICYSVSFQCSTLRCGTCTISGIFKNPVYSDPFLSNVIQVQEVGNQETQVKQEERGLIRQSQWFYTTSAFKYPNKLSALLKSILSFLPWMDVGLATLEVVVQVVSEQVNQVYCVISRVSLKQNLITLEFFWKIRNWRNLSVLGEERV